MKTELYQTNVKSQGLSIEPRSITGCIVVIKLHNHSMYHNYNYAQGRKEYIHSFGMRLGPQSDNYCAVQHNIIVAS